MGNFYTQTLHHGNGAFDGLRAYETDTGPQIFKPVAHFKRLRRALSRLQVDLDYNAQELTEIAYQLLQKNGLNNAYIRPMVYLGDHNRSTETDESYLLMAAWEWEPHIGDDLLRVMISSYHKSSINVPKDAKICGQYTNAAKATLEAKSKGFDEALLLDEDGFVVDGPGANFFFEKDEVIYTAPTKSVFPGITRETVMGFAKEMGYKVVEKKFRPEELVEADTAFFTGTAAEIAGIRSIGGHDFKVDWEDTVAYSLFLMYRQRVVNNEFRDFTLV